MNSKTETTYQRILQVLTDRKVPSLVTGGVAEEYYAGIERDTKDLDLCVHPNDLDRALAALEDAGLHTEVVYDYWLAKAFENGETLDLIFGFGNYLWPIDESWFEHAEDAHVFGVATQLVSVTDLIWMKSYVAGRERFDGADVAHLIRRASDRIDWARLLERFGDHWDLLLCMLHYYRFAYPSARHHVPAWVMRHLMEALERDIEHPSEPDFPFRGTLLDPYSYFIDIDDRDEDDPREEAARQRGLALERVRAKVDSDRKKLAAYRVERYGHELDAGP